jgi:3-methyladenine DNA glycosylase AlkD
VAADTVASIQDELRRMADERTRSSLQRFFREEITCHGVNTPVVRQIAARYFRRLDRKDKRGIFALCEELLGSDACEEAFIAFDWAYRLRGSFDPEDLDVFEYWVERYVNNWAKCDTLCNHAVGSLIERFPPCIVRLKTWAGSENRWLRRASAVSLVVPARKGLFLGDVLDIADRLLHDDDDLVRKGYGWLLKEAGKRHQDEVFGFVMEHRKDMPRTALRYAIEKMPAALRKQAMEK